MSRQPIERGQFEGETVLPHRMGRQSVTFWKRLKKRDDVFDRLEAVEERKSELLEFVHQLGDQSRVMSIRISVVGFQLK
ncbi:hypothetical protein FCG40_10820 [Fimbriimonadia bacterium ATM]|nr:hypothetical protein [Fimbriimonadia bacterium ATM]